MQISDSVRQPPNFGALSGPNFCNTAGWNSDMKFFENVCIHANLVDLNLLEVYLPNYLFKIGKNMMEIANICMNFGGRLILEFSFFGKFFS